MNMNNNNRSTEFFLLSHPGGYVTLSKGSKLETPKVNYETPFLCQTLLCLS